MIQSNLAASVYLCCLLLAGYGIAGFIKRASRLERFGFAAVLGPAAVGLCLIAISMLGIKPSPAIVIGVTALLALPLLFRMRHNRRAQTEQFKLPPVPPAPTVWKIFCMVAIGYAILAVCTDALIQPTVEWDAFAIWQLKGKILAEHALNPRPDYFQNVNFSFSHLRYPLLIPMISAAVHAMTGALTDGLEKTPDVLLFLGLGATVYSAIRRRSSATAALCATTLLLIAPMMLKFAGSGTAEIGVAAFWGCSLAAILRWQESNDPRDLLLAAFFSAALAWTKNEGLALGGVNLLAIIFCSPGLWSRRARAAGIFAVVVIAIYFPWFLYAHGLPRTDEDYAGHFSPAILLANAGRLPRIVTALVTEAGRITHWVLFWMLLAALTVGNIPQMRTRAVATLWILLLLHLACYFAAYLLIPSDLDGLLRTTTHRLLLNASPAAALLIGLLWPVRMSPDAKLSLKNVSCASPTAGI
jgi:hypothetical protein